MFLEVALIWNFDVYLYKWLWEEPQSFLISQNQHAWEKILNEKKTVKINRD